MQPSTQASRDRDIRRRTYTVSKQDIKQAIALVAPVNRGRSSSVASGNIEITGDDLDIEIVGNNLEDIFTIEQGDLFKQDISVILDALKDAVELEDVSHASGGIANPELPKAAKISTPPLAATEIQKSGDQTKVIKGKRRLLPRSLHAAPIVAPKPPACLRTAATNGTTGQEMTRQDSAMSVRGYQTVSKSVRRRAALPMKSSNSPQAVVPGVPATPAHGIPNHPLAKNLNNKMPSPNRANQPKPNGTSPLSPVHSRGICNSPDRNTPGKHTYKEPLRTNLARKSDHPLQIGKTTATHFPSTSTDTALPLSVVSETYPGAKSRAASPCASLLRRTIGALSISNSASARRFQTSLAKTTSSPSGWKKPSDKKNCANSSKVNDGAVSKIAVLWKTKTLGTCAASSELPAKASRDPSNQSISAAAHTFTTGESAFSQNEQPHPQESQNRTVRGNPNKLGTPGNSRLHYGRIKGIESAKSAVEDDTPNAPKAVVADDGISAVTGFGEGGRLSNDGDKMRASVEEEFAKVGSVKTISPENVSTDDTCIVGWSTEGVFAKGRSVSTESLLVSTEEVSYGVIPTGRLPSDRIFNDKANARASPTCQAPAGLERNTQHALWCPVKELIDSPDTCNSRSGEEAQSNVVVSSPVGTVRARSSAIVTPFNCQKPAVGCLVDCRMSETFTLCLDTKPELILTHMPAACSAAINGLVQSPQVGPSDETDTSNIPSVGSAFKGTCGSNNKLPSTDEEIHKNIAPTSITKTEMLMKRREAILSRRDNQLFCQSLDTSCTSMHRLCVNTTV